MKPLIMNALVETCTVFDGRIWLITLQKSNQMSASNSRSKYISIISFVFYLKIVRKLDYVHRVKVKVKFALQPVTKK